MPKKLSAKNQKDSVDILQFILEEFRSNFKEIDNQVTLWTEKCKSSLLPVRKVVNLSKQLQACQKANLDGFPTKFPPDIKQRVIFKIQVAVEEELAELNNNFKQLEEIQSKIKTLCSTVNKIYEQNSDRLNLNAITVATATCPSISDLLECTHELQFYFVTAYLSRKFSIQNINLKDEANMNDFKNSWQEFDVFTSRLKDIYPFILYFVSENL